jgi:heat shock protein HslJ
MKAMGGSDRTMTRVLAGAALAALAVTLAASGAEARERGGKKEAADPKAAAEERYKQEKTYPTKTTWALRSINGKAVPADYEITFMIDENFRGSGFGGCNYWSATIYPQREQKLLAGPVAVTKKMCEPARMQLERAFLVGVHSGPNWDLQGHQMTLKGKGGTLVFDRAL